MATAICGLTQKAYAYICAPVLAAYAAGCRMCLTAYVPHADLACPAKRRAVKGVGTKVSSRDSTATTDGLAKEEIAVSPVAVRNVPTGFEAHSESHNTFACAPAVQARGVSSSIVQAVRRGKDVPVRVRGVAPSEEAITA